MFLGAGILLTTQLAQLYSAEMITTCSSLFGLLLISTLQRHESWKSWFVETGIRTVGIGAVLAGFFLMEDASLGPWLHWTIREFFGVLLVLVLLRHQQVLNTVSTPTTKAICRALFLSVATVWALVSVFGAPEEPGHGVVTTYLAFGYVPPLFLAVLTIPYYIHWTLLSDDNNLRSDK